jgi:hypothetical protein
MKTRRTAEFPVTDPEWLALEGQLLYAANTDDRVDWSRISSLRAGVPALSDRERCDLLLRIANSEPLLAAQWNAMVGAVIASGYEGYPVAVPVPTKHQKQVETVLGAIAKSPAGAARQYGDEVAKVCERGVLELPQYVKDRGALVMRRVVVCRSFGVALTYTMMLLLDPGRPHGRALCRCQYRECRRFFFEPPRAGAGRPGRKYCPGTDHADLEDQARAVKRNQKMRARIRAAGSMGE